MTIDIPTLTRQIAEQSELGAQFRHDDDSHKDSAKRDANSGVAALDSTGQLLATGNALLLTRNGSNQMFVTERTSDETCLRLNRVAINDYSLSMNYNGAWQRVPRLSEILAFG